MQSGLFSQMSFSDNTIGVEVKLVSSDGVVYKFPSRAVRLSKTISLILEEVADASVIKSDNQGDLIPVDVESDVMNKVQTYLLYYMDNPVPDSEEDKKAKVTDNISEWDKEFIDMEQILFFRLMKTALYLEIQPLLDLCCKTVANQLKGKTPSQIRELYNIRIDAEEAKEMEELRKKYEDLDPEILQEEIKKVEAKKMEARILKIQEEDNK